MYGTMCAAATARGYGMWIQSTSVNKMITKKWTRGWQRTIALKSNRTDTFCVWYKRDGCKSIHRDYDGTGTECENGNSEA